MLMLGLICPIRAMVSTNVLLMSVDAASSAGDDALHLLADVLERLERRIHVELASPIS